MSLALPTAALAAKPDLAEAAINLGTALEAAGDTEGALAAWRAALPPPGLRQILHNLLNNALQAMHAVPAAQRCLQLRIGIESGRGVLRLRDGGPGLTPDVLDHLFEPFFSTRPGGLGLGLSLCASLAGAMGGVLSAQNVAAGGAEFRLELPLTCTR